MTEPAAVPPTEPPAAEPAPSPVTDWEAEAKKWKETSLKIETRANTAAAAAKANEEAAKELQAIRDRELPELDRLKKAVAENEARALEAERRLLRADVAMSKGLPPEVVGALVGNTAEELSAHADALLAWRGSVVPATPPAPRPDQSQGAQPVSPQGAADADYEAYKSLIFPSHQQ